MWFYISFSGPEGFIAACYVPGDTEGEALQAVSERGLRPDGTDNVLPLGPLSDEDMDENVADGDRNRLLARGELGPNDSVYV